MSVSESLNLAVTSFPIPCPAFPPKRPTPPPAPPGATPPLASPSCLVLVPVPPTSPSLPCGEAGGALGRPALPLAEECHGWRSVITPVVLGKKLKPFGRQQAGCFLLISLMTSGRTRQSWIFLARLLLQHPSIHYNPPHARRALLPQGPLVTATLISLVFISNFPLLSSAFSTLHPAHTHLHPLFLRSSFRHTLL